MLVVVVVKSTVPPLALRLREARKATGLRQREVAEHLGLAEAVSVSRWERGVQRPDNRRLADVAELYGVTLDWLIGEEAA